MATYLEELVSSLAAVLNLRRVPCVLWGHCLLQIHGVPTIVASVDFVIPDQLLETAVEALSHEPRLKPCTGEGRCARKPEEHYSAPPAAHFHIESSDRMVDLHVQSRLLWFLPPLDDALLDATELSLPGHFTLASDQTTLPPARPGRGSGVFTTGSPPVIIPRSHVLLEAYLRLYARDSGKRNGSTLMPMIAYMEMYVDDDGYLDSDQLPEPLKAFYKELEADTKPVRQWGRELKITLGEPVEMEET